MPYTIPTVAQFRERFPEFTEAAYPDATVEAALNRAARQVDETWLEADYQEAIMLLAAHDLAVTTFGVESLGQGWPRAISLGPLSLTYGEKGQPSVSDYATTLYGQGFAELRKKNIPAIAVI